LSSDYETDFHLHNPQALRQNCLWKSHVFLPKLAKNVVDIIHARRAAMEWTVPDDTLVKLLMPTEHELYRQQPSAESRPLTLERVRQFRQTQCNGVLYRPRLTLFDEQISIATLQPIVEDALIPQWYKVGDGNSVAQSEFFHMCLPITFCFVEPSIPFKHLY
jgi:hypothetical protein